MTDTEGTPTGDEPTTADNTEEQLSNALDSSEEQTDIVHGGEQSEDVDSTDTPAEDADTFPREYVEKLRGQNAKYRDRAKVADLYAQRLHLELVRATGRLADPSDLEFDEEHIEDTAALTAAVDELLANKPHLASRRPTGDIGQGQRGAASEPFSLLGLLKERT